MTRQLFAPLLSLLLLSPLLTPAAADTDRGIRPVQRPAAAQQPRTALVIGNSGYRSAPLRNPVNDARAIADKLRTLGFDVILETDADQRQILHAIRTFGSKLRDRQGAGVFYFAGHGMQIDGRNYLIPIGTDIQAEDEVAYQSIDVGQVLDKMESAGSQPNLVILDACRNNPFARSFRSARQGLAQMDSPSGTLIAFATAPGNVAADGDGEHGIYTQHLLEHMETPGLDVGQMFRRVRADVMRATGDKQVPWESSSLVGDFYFKPPNAAAAARPAQPTRPSPAVAPAQAGGIDSSIELEFWNSIKGTDNPAYLHEYLRRYPSGHFATLAKLMLDDLERASPAPAPAPRPSGADARTPTLLAQAREDERALRLTTPAGNNAHDRYRQVLAMDPGNAEARAGLERIVDRYVEWAERSISRSDFDKAGSYLDRAESVMPGNERIAFMREMLASERAAAYSAPGDFTAPGGWGGGTASVPANLVGTWIASFTDFLGNPTGSMQVTFMPNGRYTTMAFVGGVSDQGTGSYQVQGNLITGMDDAGESFTYTYVLLGDLLILNMPELGGNINFARQ
jgi:uncharacterized caspase-like protein